MTSHRTFHAELIDTLAEPGCAFCRLAARSVSRYLDILSYENVNDVDLRATIREGIGLCNRHAWQFIDGTRTPLGTAIIYRDLIRTLQQRTADSPRPTDEVAARLRALVPARSCVACGALATMVNDCAHQVLQSWADPAFRAAFAQSDGLCWAHFLATLEADRFARRWRGLLDAQHAAWTQRIDRARGESGLDLLQEALSSSPRLNGTQIDPAEAGPMIDPGEVLPVRPVRNGRCSTCVTVQAWLAATPMVGDACGPGLLCAVHAWHPARVRPAEHDDANVSTMRALEERMSGIVAGDLAGFAPLRLAKRLRRGRVLPPEVDRGLACPLCPAQSRQEAMAVAQLEPSTLCVPHLRVAAYHAPRFAPFRAKTREAWHSLEGELDEFIRKHDYRFNKEARGGEQDSFVRAVALVAGEEGVR